jgi:hypothetical protein
MALWELDEFAPPVFLGFVRSVPPPAPFRGTRWLPDRTVSDLEFEYILGANRLPVMAHVMGFDSEAPLHGRPGAASRVTGELTPIKRKARIGEKTIIRFLAPRAGLPDQAEAVSQVYSTTGDLLDAIQARMEWLRMQALSEDKVVYDDSGVKFSFDYGIDDTLQIDLSNETNGAGTSVAAAYSTVWTDTANSDPVSDMATLNNALIAKQGVGLGEVVVSSLALPYLYRNDKLRTAIRGAGAPTAPLAAAEVNLLLQINGLPPISTYDVIVKSEQADGSYVDVRPMATNKLFGVPSSISVGETLWGPTAESRVLYGTPLAGRAPGIWAETYGTTEPPSEWTKAAAVAFPSMPQANQLVQMKIAAAPL